MAVKAEFKFEGLEMLQERLTQKAEQLKSALDMRLLQLCEDAVTYSKEHKGYKDRTANLKNSISFALFRDGELLRMYEGKLTVPNATKEGQAQVSENLQEYANSGVVAPKGYSLVIVAGMNYGVYVEHRGYNVLHLTKYYLKDELEKILGNVIESLNK